VLSSIAPRLPPHLLSTRRALLAATLLPLLSLPASAAPLFGPSAVDAARAAKAPTAEATASPEAALQALLAARAALADAAAVVGSGEARRARLCKGLARNAAALQTLAALLPLVYAQAYGTLPADDERLAGYGDILIAAKNVSVMARIQSETGFTDEQVPQATLDAGLAEISRLMVALPGEALTTAARQRCRSLLGAAASFEEMRDVANGPVCLGVM